jgi:diacylglycerol kinase (ATP)
MRCPFVILSLCHAAPFVILLLSGGEIDVERKMRAAAILGLGSCANHLKPFARNTNATFQFGVPASTSDADAILIFGGDGTVHRHLAALVALQLPVLVVPHGSGNDFARALNLRSVHDSVNAWRQFASGQGNVRQIDLGFISSPGAAKIQGHYFCCVGGIGLDAEIARRANQLPRWIRRRGGYLLSLLPALYGFEPLPVTVQAAEPSTLGALATRHDGPAVVVAFANAPAYGGGIKIAPNARLDDGQLDICVVGNMSKARLLRLFPSVFSGSHLRIPEVKYFQTERLRLETEQPMDVYADGEYVCRTPVEVSVERAALRVIDG